MEKIVFFDDARTNVLEFFTHEFPSLSIDQVDTFISVFYRLTNYEEEGKKIKPIFLITSNINAVVRAVPKAKKIVFYEDKDLHNFKARMKALMCFCKFDWNIYINFDEDSKNVEYGIINSLTSIKEKTLVDYLSQQSVLENIGKKINLIILNIMGSAACSLIGAKGNSCSVHFNLNSDSEYHWNREMVEFVDACSSKIKTTKNKLADIKNLIANIFHRVLRDLHGTICVVVDKDYQDSGFLSDGTWLKEPIEFGKLFLRSKTFDENVLRSYADILTTMLDYDGITVLDNAGRIRAYNVFVESNAASNYIVGGARRRAAYTILKNKAKKILGVYFQSQEGDNFYKSKEDLKKKKKIKVVNGEVINQEKDEMLPLKIVAELQQQKQEQESVVENAEIMTEKAQNEEKIFDTQSSTANSSNVTEEKPKDKSNG